MQIGRKMTDLEAVEVLSVVLAHPVYIYIYINIYKHGYAHCFVCLWVCDGDLNGLGAQSTFTRVEI